MSDAIEFKGKSTSFAYEEDIGIVHIQGAFGPEAEVDIDDILAFVAEVIVRPKLIEVIKNAEPNDLLLGQFNPLPLTE